MPKYFPAINICFYVHVVFHSARGVRVIENSCENGAVTFRELWIVLHALWNSKIEIVWNMQRCEQKKPEWWM